MALKMATNNAGPRTRLVRSISARTIHAPNRPNLFRVRICFCPIASPEGEKHSTAQNEGRGGEERIDHTKEEDRVGNDLNTVAYTDYIIPAHREAMHMAARKETWLPTFEECSLAANSTACSDCIV